MRATEIINNCKVALALAVLLSILLPATSYAISRNAYVQEVRATLALVSRAQGSQPNERAGYVHQAVQSLDRMATEQIDTQHGPITPYVGYISDTLTQSPPDLDKAELYLRSLLNELDAGEPQAEDGNSKQKLEHVLSDPRFDYNRSQQNNTLLDRFVQWLLEQLSKIPVGGVGPTQTSSLNVGKWLIVLLCVLLVAFVVWLFVRSGRRFSWQRRESSAAAVMTTPESMLASATDYARGGDYRAAVRAYFIAVLLMLHERGQLRYVPALTNREHLRRVGQGTPLAESLAPLVNTFDDVWYGRKPISQSQYDSYRQYADSLLAGKP